MKHLNKIGSMFLALCFALTICATPIYALESEPLPDGTEIVQDGKPTINEVEAPPEEQNDVPSTGPIGIFMPGLILQDTDGDGNNDEVINSQEVWDALQDPIVDAETGEVVVDEDGNEVTGMDLFQSGELTPETFEEIYEETPAEMAGLPEPSHDSEPTPIYQGDEPMDLPSPPKQEEKVPVATTATVETFEELEAAIAAGASEIVIASDITASSTLNIADTVTISGGSITRNGDFTIFDVNGDLTLIDTTLKGSSAETFNTTIYGKKVEAHNTKSPIVVESGGNLVLDGSSITGFYARRGGGINTQGNVTLINASIDNNTVFTNDDQIPVAGGGIYIDNGGSVIMDAGSSVSGNKATGSYPNWQAAIGGGIAIKQGGAFTMNGGFITGNSVNGCAATSEGGGIAIGSDSYSHFEGLGTPDGSKINLNAGTISGNTAHRGGGIYIHNGVTIKLKDVEITNNSSGTPSASYNPWGPQGYGGGLGFCFNGSVEFKDGSGVLITENTAAYGCDIGAEVADWISVPDTAPNGTPYTWHQDCQYGPLVYNGSSIEDMDAWFDEFMNWSEGWENLGLRSSISAEANDYNYKLIITDNTCDDFGGGIACNGKLVIGDNVPPPPKIPDLPKEPLTTSLTVEKVWANSDGSIMEQAPEGAAAVINLYIEGTEEAVDTVTLPIDGKWSYTFEDLPIKVDGEKVLSYYVGEVEVEGYTSTQVTVDGIIVITNTQVPPPPPDNPPPPTQPDPDPEPEPEPDDTPDPGPDTNIPDEPPPLIDLPDEEPPLADIPEEEPPLVEEPPLEEIPDEDIPLADIPEEDVPMAEVPQTGDASALWANLMFVSGIALIILGKKRYTYGS